MLDARRDCAVALVLEAGALAASMRATLGPAEAKSPIDFCTEADRAVERLIRTRLGARFGDSVLGEEDGGAASDSVWVVDPIDGTHNYIHGDARWCVSLAYVRDGVVELGLILAPDTRSLFVAQRGAGARCNEAPLGVSHLRRGGAQVEVGWSERVPVPRYGGVLERLVADDIEFRRRGSGALALADVAAGSSDGYIELHINAWDALAGILLVTEAGGRTNDFLADEGLTRGNRLVAATPELFGRLERAAA